MCQYPISRREWLKLAAMCTAAGAAPLLGAMQARAASEPDAPVRVGYLPITDAVPLLVAHRNGYFDANGLKAEKPTLLRSWAQLVEAFLSGQVNVVHLLSPMTVWARYGAHAPAKVVAWNHVNGSALTVAPHVNSLADLGGKTVALPFWYSIHNVVLQDLLRSAELSPVLKKTGAPQAHEVNLIVMPPSDMPPALAGGRIAGFIVAEPFNAAAENLKIGKVLRFTGDVWKNHACCVVFMHERDLNERAAWSQKVVDAIVNAQLWTRAHPAEAARLLSKEGSDHYTPHPLPVLQRVLAPDTGAEGRYLADRAVLHADWHERRIDFQPYPFPSYTE
ncbi:MAG: ABC transporter substrate-binding protein, partial [Janthinobacterium lividum]